MSKIIVRKNLNRWFKEKWVDVSRTGKDGKHPPCGRSKAKTSSKGYPKCRPSVKVSSKTPKTSGSMTSGQKRAATKRKRAKKQGVGGKPTIVKQEEPFEAFDEETPDPVVDTFMSMHQKVPVKVKQFEAMERARKDPSVHPGIGSRHIFDTPFGHSTAVEPTVSGTNALFPLPNSRPVVFGQQFQIADPKQMARLSRDVDDEDDMEGDGMFHAEAYQMPGVQTELVSPHGTKVDDKPAGYYSQAMARVPTFRGMPFNEETYFTTGEPMDLAFRLLKDDDNQSFTDTRTMERYLREREERKKEEELRQYPRPFAEFSYEELHHIRQNPSLYNLESGYSGFSRNELENELDQRDVENSPYFDPEFQDIHTGEPMDLAFRLLKYGGRRPPIGVHLQMGRLRQIKEGRHRGLEDKPIPLVGVHRAGYTQEYTPEQAAALPVNQQQSLQMQQPSKEVQYMRMKRFPNEQPQGNETEAVTGWDAGAGFMNYATVHPPSPMLPTGSTELPQVNSNQAEDFLM